jgi:integrase
MRSWDASDRTIEARTILAKARLQEWGLEGFTTENVQTFLGSEGWSRWTRATYYAHLKSICEYLVAAGLLRAPSPMEDVRRVQRPRSIPKPLSKVEMARALAAAVTHPDPRILDWIALARREGLRCHEIAKLRGEDLTERGLYVLGKGNKEAVLPIHPEVAAMVTRYPTTGWWFPSPYGGHIQADSLSAVISKFFGQLGIKGSIHRVRHNFGTDLVEGGNDLRVVQELMRHSSLATTAGYTAVSADRLSAAINRLPMTEPYGGPDAA